MSSMTFRKYLPLAITSLSGFIMLFEYFLVFPEFKVAADFLRSISSRAAGVSLLIANVVLVRWQWTKIKQSTSRLEKIAQSVMYPTMGTYIIVGLVLGVDNQIYKDLSFWTWSGLMYGVIGTLVFWEVFAAYRALRAKTMEGLALLVAAVIVIIAMSPWSYMFIYPNIEGLDAWLVSYISQPATTAILMGAGIGGTATAIRTMLWKEKSYIRA